MSRLVERTVTLFIDREDVDVPMRAWVDVGHTGATIDGRVEVFVAGEWTEMDPKLVDKVEDLLCEQAITEDAEAVDDRDPGDFAC